MAALERVDSTGRLDVLRDLTKDSDVDVAENALRTLNEALRSTLPAIAAETVWDIPLAKAGVHVPTGSLFARNLQPYSRCQPAAAPIAFSIFTSSSSVTSENRLRLFCASRPLFCMIKRTSNDARLSGISTISLVSSSARSCL